MLNYVNINQQYRANSILEAYNPRIKKLLPCKSDTARFVELIVNEENYYNLELARKINHGGHQNSGKNFTKRNEIKVEKVNSKIETKRSQEKK